MNSRTSFVLREQDRNTAIYDIAIGSAPADEYLKVDKAVVLYKAGSRSEAERSLSTEQSKAKTANDFNYICHAEARAGIYLTQAVKDCQEALRISPSFGKFDLGLALLRIGNLDAAANAFSEALKANRSSGSAYFGRAIAYANKGDASLAVADRNEALKLDPYVSDRFAEYGLKLDLPLANQPETLATNRN